MDPYARTMKSAITFAALAHALACSPTDADLALMEEEEQPDDLWQEEEVVDKGQTTPNGLTGINGLTAANGLITTNGLKVTNGLSTQNGLTTVNGLTTMNGLATRGGLSTYQGKFVNCQGRADSSCTSPDGLLSRTTGLMKSAGGVTTAQYLVRCALTASSVIRIQDYTGAFVSLQGQLGLAPEWATGSCSRACEEKVSACLLALINQAGQHSSVTMTGAWGGNPLGTSHEGYNMLEGSFFGNVFKDSAEAYVVSGYDHAQTVADVERGILQADGGLALRSCNQAGAGAKTYQKFLDALPYCSVKNIGTSAPATIAWPALKSDPTNYDKCSFASTDAAFNGVASRSTALACSGPGTSRRDWSYVISTWRRANPWIARRSETVEGESASFGCEGGGVIKYISFASYGNPTSVHYDFKQGSCHAASSQSKIEAACLNKQSCSILANNTAFGGDPCPGTPKRLLIGYGCEN